MSDGKLPEGWVECELSALGHIVTGKTPSTKEPSNFGGDIPFIKPGDLDLGGYITVTADTLTEKGLALVPTLPTNSIVVTCIGNLGKVGITTIRSASNQQINALIPSEKLNVKFIYYQILTLKPWLESQSAATTIAIVNKSKFSQAPFKFPPISEQKIIAEKLDTLLAQVDSTKVRLEQIPQILKRFRQAVLAAAVNGRLTESWRTENASKTTKNLLRDHIPLPKPARWKTRATSLILGVHATAVGNPGKSPVAEWQWVPLVDVARMESGHTPSRNKPEYWDGEICWIGIRDANRNHSSTIFDTEQKTNELGIANSASRLLPKGTVCISRTASVGYVVKMGKSMATSQDFVNWVPSDVIDADWLKWLFVAEKESLFKFGKGSTHTTIYFPEWLSLHILLPHISEQHEIVRRVEQLFAYADTIEKQVNNALTRVNSLTQSILAKAFRGELTAQWRAENPDLISGENSAAALLEKIKAERAASGGKKTSRKKT
ncbi:restriction endonuclease subunit S [Klebsiella aerogenes]|nr:restriction endonuclease subunit S [Klebsiella aerogenes]